MEWSRQERISIWTLKIFRRQCHIKDNLCPSANTSARAHRACTRTASQQPLLCSSGIFFRTTQTFFSPCHRDAAIPPTSMAISQPWLVWLSLCSGWDEPPGLSKEPPGWPPSPSPPARSYRFAAVKFFFKAVRLCLFLATRVIRAIHPTQTFSGRRRRTASLSSCLCPKTAPQLAFSVVGTSYVTGHCAIENWPRHRAMSRPEGRYDRRQVFANFIVGKDKDTVKSMVNFSFLGALAFYSNEKRGNL